MATPLTATALEAALGPLLTALASPAASAAPPAGLLPFLTPLLRHRLTYLSSEASPWPQHLSPNPGLPDFLSGLRESGLLEMHPVSGMVEVDWEDCEVVYQRVDVESLTSWVTVRPLEDMRVFLVWRDDEDGKGWGVSGVYLASHEVPRDGKGTVEEAEAAFKEWIKTQTPVKTAEETQDDDYWNQYDDLPSETPGAGTPIPAGTSTLKAPSEKKELTEEDSYCAQYESVQPALDSHDPDEQAHLDIAGISSTLGSTQSRSIPAPVVTDIPLHQPLPTSSPKSVRTLEQKASKESHRDLALHHHISSSVQNLWHLARDSGMDWRGFNDLVTQSLKDEADAI